MSSSERGMESTPQTRRYPRPLSVEARAQLWKPSTTLCPKMEETFSIISFMPGSKASIIPNPFLGVVNRERYRKKKKRFWRAIGMSRLLSTSCQTMRASNDHKASPPLKALARMDATFPRDFGSIMSSGRYGVNFFFLLRYILMISRGQHGRSKSDYSVGFRLHQNVHIIIECMFHPLEVPDLLYITRAVPPHLKPTPARLGRYDP